MSAERAWYQTSPLGSPVRSIILGTSLTCQKMLPLSSSSTLSEVRTVYSKKAYCARRSIFDTLTLPPAAPPGLCSAIHSIVTRRECGGRKKAVPAPAPCVSLPLWNVYAPSLSCTITTSCGSTRISCRTSTISSCGPGKKRPRSVTRRVWPDWRERTSAAVLWSMLTASVIACLTLSVTVGKSSCSPRSTRTRPVTVSTSLTNWLRRSWMADWRPTTTCSVGSGTQAIGPATRRTMPDVRFFTLMYSLRERMIFDCTGPTESYAPTKMRPGPERTDLAPVIELLTWTYDSSSSIFASRISAEVSQGLNVTKPGPSTVYLFWRLGLRTAC
mmetsp:Transcript_25387/g.64679  ORF Transcript_25387/g.64679 Transcript_25387/m.64679 type:complete len:329 (+) Transcript_25387:805-1791(+)